MPSVRNVHTRRVPATVERVRPWIEALWSGGARDCFPRDAVPSWRRNPPGVDPLALVPGKTILGHGPFRFRLREWDGRVWRADVMGGGVGWHGFDLAPDGDGCRVTYKLELDANLPARVGWLAIQPIHDWAVEAVFDRLEQALRTGAVPERTERPTSWVAAVALAVLRRAPRGRAADQPGRTGPDASVRVAAGHRSP